jgi:predicted amidophosphoribosyltransferase
VGRVLLDLLAPPRCLACGAPGPGPLCAACRAALPWLGPVCPRCALPRRAGCPPCPARRAAFAAAWAPVAMAGPARALVHALKLDGARGAAGAMAATLVRGVPPGPVALVPVPPAPARARRRGVDHAALLAGALARRAGRAGPAPPVVACLERTGPGRQVGAPRPARLAGPPVHARGRAPARVVVLVDDVHTTGGTLDACARALRAAGAHEVRALTFARTLP